MEETEQHNANPVVMTMLFGVGICLGVVVALLAHDVIAGVIAGAVLIAVGTQIVKLWSGHGHGQYGHR